MYVPVPLLIHWCYDVPRIVYVSNQVLPDSSYDCLHDWSVGYMSTNYDYSGELGDVGDILIVI